MNAWLARGLFGILLLASAPAWGWSAWDAYKAALISDDGRVIDPSTRRQVTTSEGQSYALFFALVADDREAFARLLTWTQNNLAEGDLAHRLPAWQWGRRDDGTWGVLDANNASDADLWIAYALMEAGRLWQRPDYRQLGIALVERMAREIVVEAEGLGLLVLPGRQGFIGDDHWRINPSYLPPFLLDYLAKRLGAPWDRLAGSLADRLITVSPAGFAPDWAAWHRHRGWIEDPRHGAVGSYDAIRVYLWLGMLAPQHPDRERLLRHFAPLRHHVARTGTPPETTDARRGCRDGAGNLGFSAALLPFLSGTPAHRSQALRLAGQWPAPDAYYSRSLLLFGLGWDQGHYRFAPDGALRPAWVAP